MVAFSLAFFSFFRFAKLKFGRRIDKVYSSAAGFSLSPQILVLLLLPTATTSTSTSTDILIRSQKTGHEEETQRQGSETASGAPGDRAAHPDRGHRLGQRSGTGSAGPKAVHRTAPSSSRVNPFSAREQESGGEAQAVTKG